MPDLLTPAELAAIKKAHDDGLPMHPHEKDALFAHIAALEARTPAPATDVDALLAAAERDAASDEADWAFETPLAKLLRRLATALRESRAREVAEPYRHALEQRLICSNLPLLTGDADADLMRFVFHEQELALSPEAGVIAELKEQRDTALSWTATYTNMDVYRRCLTTAIARAEKAEADLADLTQTTGELCPECHWRGVRDDGCEFCKAHRLEADLAAARKELAGLEGGAQ